MMMKSKLCAALCALLLVVHLGSAEYEVGHTAASNASEATAAGPVPVSNPDTHPVAQPSPSGPDANSSSRVNSSFSSNTTTGGKNASVTAETKNGTDTAAPTEAAGPEKNQTDLTMMQSAIPPSGTHASASPTPLTPTTTPTTTTTTTSPTSATPTTTADTPTTTTPPTNTSHPAGIPLPGSTAPSNTSLTTATTPEPLKSETTAGTAITTALVLKSTPTSSTSSSQGPLHNVSTLTPLGPGEHPEVSTAAWQKSTAIPSSSPSTQAKSHADRSQLNDTTVQQNTPTLDPLLAGLVSAFIITAVIITLLLFLKLRRRDNRPEFRRLQDLPMDDMMEDTPLSMYSY